MPAASASLAASFAAAASCASSGKCDGPLTVERALVFADPDFGPERPSGEPCAALVPRAVRAAGPGSDVGFVDRGVFDGACAALLVGGRFLLAIQ
ncbi:MAG TPA: hypothetical protein VNS57_14320 [Steroidobacteraceae bacterium]|nr:hypothetical protein [Steroidobacteraceae bacterium]